MCAAYMNILIYVCIFCIYVFISLQMYFLYITQHIKLEIRFYFEFFAHINLIDYKFSKEDFTSEIYMF